MYDKKWGLIEFDLSNFVYSLTSNRTSILCFSFDCSFDSRVWHSQKSNQKSTQNYYFGCAHPEWGQKAVKTVWQCWWWRERSNKSEVSQTRSSTVTSTALTNCWNSPSFWSLPIFFEKPALASLKKIDLSLDHFPEILICPNHGDDEDMLEKHESQIRSNNIFTRGSSVHCGEYIQQILY